MASGSAASGQVARWSGTDVSVGEIEMQLARLRTPTPEESGVPHQRTSVMTHVAWVPPRWLDAAERTLEGMAQRHPSRTVILVPERDEPDGVDALLWMRCFSVGQREICGEVVELHLRGERALAPSSIVVPLAIADLPVFLRWRGEPPFAAGHWAELVDLADRVVVDSSEWGELRYAELAAVFERSAVSDIAWARIYPWRVALSRRWPAIRDQEIAIRGPRAEAALLGSWLSARLGRVLAPAGESDVLAVSLAGEDVPPAAEQPRSPSDLLSAELDRTGRDPIYEQAVAAYVAG